MFSLNRLQQPAFWLVGIAAAIVAIHLTLINRAGDFELLTTSVLFWVVAGFLLWERRSTLSLESTMQPTLVGLILLVLVFVRSAALPSASTTLKVLPIIAILGLALLASGFRGGRQYWRELLIFGLLALHPLLESFLQIINLPQLTAKASMLLLWYAGFEVKRQELFLLMPTGRVEIYGACSGVQSILQMLGIGILFLLLFPIRSATKKILCLLIAVLIGFLVNAARVSLMAILVAFAQNDAFEYWHSGDGSLIFSVISVAIFGGVCWFVFLRPPEKRPETGIHSND